MATALATNSIYMQAWASPGKAILDTLTPERRAMARVATVPQAAELIGKYIDAGFTGFTLNNNVYGTPESIALAGELIKRVNKVPAPR
jgi:hypothetical protein